tara:strand:- start:3298 stop:3567 length:270 start_codon:yes stop_codon:yes gene_type:complete
MGNMDEVRDANSSSCWNNYDIELEKERQQIAKIKKFAGKTHYVTINGHEYGLDGKYVISQCKDNDLQKTLKILAFDKYIKYIENKSKNT